MPMPENHEITDCLNRIYFNSVVVDAKLLLKHLWEVCHGLPGKDVEIQALQRALTELEKL